ncbi:hypothetical protein ACFSC3_09800 [Sphingomonas floccifaciens]|uniref:Uncharacterized protein n=1 Tax=Sphingomonas floccifaciens TaxID=1844115 RepID=A0ABW4NCZ5_9SPHN
MGTITETTGRSASFLQATSMALVALGFLAPATNFGPVFMVFAVLLLLVLLMVGLVTFLRCVQLGVEDSRLAQQAEEVMRFYAEAAPALEERIGAPRKSGDPGEAAVGVKIPGQTLLTNASLIALVEAALCGVLAALVAHLAGSGLAVCAVIGGAVAAACTFTLLRLQSKLWNRAMDR